MLACLWRSGDNFWVYDKSDMTLECVNKYMIIEYLKNCGSIEGVSHRGDFGIVCESKSGYSKGYNGWQLSGIFRGASYIADIDNLTQCNYYTDNKVFTLRLLSEKFMGNNTVFLDILREDCHVASSLFTKVYHTENIATFVPLKDGLYVFIDGSLVYKVGELPSEYARRYSTSTKLKEVLLSC